MTIHIVPPWPSLVVITFEGSMLYPGAGLYTDGAGLVLLPMLGLALTPPGSTLTHAARLLPALRMGYAGGKTKVAAPFSITCVGEQV